MKKINTRTCNIQETVCAVETTEGGPRKVNVKIGSMEERAFEQSQNGELTGLLKDHTFQTIHESSITGAPRIFDSRFVDEVKKVGWPEKEESSS